ncbi:MAG: 50S ribosomal protein L25 [Cytophagales bacterium]|nr:50S ribosomal protein L25 [Cytophagales bacterium]
MKIIDVVAYRRQELGGKASRRLRRESLVPAVLYGAGLKSQHISVPAFLFRKLVHTAEAFFTRVDIEGDEHICLVQDLAFHPVSDIVLHADFLVLEEGKKTKMSIPIRCTGQAPGVLKGGALVQRIHKIRVKALPKDMPDFISIDIGQLELNQFIRVGDLSPQNYEILDNLRSPIVSVEVPRSLRGKDEEEEAAKEKEEPTEETNSENE